MVGLITEGIESTMDEKSVDKQESKYIWTDLVFVAIVCAALGLAGGTPFLHPDRVVSRALIAVQSMGNPHNFHYPALVIYLNSVVYGVIYGAMILIGSISGPAEFEALYKSGMYVSSPGIVSFYLPAHLITIMFSVTGALCCYLLTWRLLRDRLFSIIAGLMLATSLLWVADSHYGTVDVPVAALAIVTVLFIVYILDKHTPLRLRDVVVIGVLIGLTASAKYTGALVAVSAVAIWGCYQKRGSWLKHLVFVGAVSIIVFFVTNPYIVLDRHTFLTDFRFELDHARVGHEGWTVDRSWIFHLKKSLMVGFGLPLLGLSVLGLGWFATHRKFSAGLKFAVISFPLVYYLIIGSSNLAFQRYALPIAPFIAVFATVGIYVIYLWTRRIITNRKAAILRTAFVMISVVLMVPNIRNGIRHNALLSEGDTRADVLKIISSAGLDSPDRSIFAGDYTRYFFDQTVPLEREDMASAEWVDVLIFDSFSHDRFVQNDAGRLTFDPQLFSDRTVVTLTPFRVEKEDVPYTPKSIYSPYPPDLEVRKRSGPYVEMYIDSDELQSTILNCCRSAGIKCTTRPAVQGYYYQHVAKRRD